MIPKAMTHYKKAAARRVRTIETPVLPHRGLCLEREEGGTPGRLVSISVRLVFEPRQHLTTACSSCTEGRPGDLPELHGGPRCREERAYAGSRCMPRTWISRRRSSSRARSASDSSSRKARPQSAAIQAGSGITCRAIAASRSASSAAMAAWVDAKTSTTLDTGLHRYDFVCGDHQFLHQRHGPDLAHDQTVLDLVEIQARPAGEEA